MANSKQRIIYAKIFSSNKNDGLISNIETFNKNQPIIMEWDSKGKPPSIIVDFGEKVSGILNINTEQPLALDGYFTRLIGRYGPQKDRLLFNLSIPSGDYFTPDLFVARYLELKISSLYPSHCKVIISNIKLMCTELPLSNIAKFESDNELLNKIWNFGVRTVQMCVQPNNLSGYASHYHTENRKWLSKWKSPFGKNNNYTIWDGVRRDREMWVGDARWASPTWLYSGGNIEPVLNCFELVKELQEPDGELVVSGFSRQKFLDYSLYYNSWLWELYEWVGDINKVKPYYECFTKNLNWIIKRLDNRGFFPQPKSNKYGVSYMYSLKLGGIITATQANLYGSLRDSVKLLNVFGEYEKAKEIELLVSKIYKSINKFLYDYKLNIYKTMIEGNDEIKSFMHDSSVFCLNEGVTSKKQIPYLLESIKKYFWTPYGAANSDIEMPKDADIYIYSNWVHNHQIWLYSNVVEIEARFKCGDMNGGLELIKRCYGNMINKGANTFWEMALSKDGSFPSLPFFADVYDSYCHSASGRISYLLQAYLSGLRSNKPGWEELLISPQLNDLKWINTSVATPRGIIRLELERKESNLSGRLELPKGIKYIIKKQDYLEDIHLDVNYY